MSAEQKVEEPKSRRGDAPGTGLRRRRHVSHHTEGDVAADGRAFVTTSEARRVARRRGRAKRRATRVIAALWAVMVVVTMVMTVLWAVAAIFDWLW